MINMRRCTRFTPTTSGDDTICYLRTFHFTPAQLINVLEVMFLEGIGTSSMAYVLYEKMLHLRAVTAPDGVVIRYSGVSGSVSAWTRHKQDLLKAAVTPHHAPLLTVLSITRRSYPRIIHRAVIDEFLDATVRGKFSAQRQQVVDLREQSMIALFGPRTMLNTAKGGLKTSFLSHQQDLDLTACL